MSSEKLSFYKQQPALEWIISDNFELIRDKRIHLNLILKCFPTQIDVHSQKFSAHQIDKTSV